MNRITATLLCLMLCLAGTSLHATAFAAEQTSVSAPTPAPATRPFPAPVTTRTVTVPASIDATGSSDVTAALNAFLATVPDGSIISFPTGAIYLLDTQYASFHISNRHNLVFEGNGATLKAGPNASMTSAYASQFMIGDDSDYPNTDIVVHAFILIGNSPTPGVFIPGLEQQKNLHVAYTTRVEIYNITGSAAPADFLMCYGSNEVWVHDCHALTVGRNGITVISGSNILVEYNAFDVSGYCTFDIEPDFVTQPCSDVTIRNNTAGTFGLLFFAVEGSHTGAMIDGIVVDGNTATGGSLKMLVDNGGTARMTRIAFTDNKGEVAATGPVLQFMHVDGLTVTGNIQPLSSGALTSIADCTGAR